MKKFFSRVGRFFWSRGFLKFVLWTITLIILFYAEEDWRGARAWAATKKKWEAKGESFDYAKFIPPSVPAEENLAALPIFAVDPVSHEPEALIKALRGAPFNNYPKMGNFLQGETFDVKGFQTAVLKDYGATFPEVAMPSDSLAQLDQLYPFMADLRSATANRPLCHFDGNYDIYPPENRSLGLITEQINLARLIVLHALFALHENQSDLALADLKLNYRLASGVERDPSLIGSLVAESIEAMNNGVVIEGLALHAWNDAQLSTIQECLGRFDVLRNFQFCLRAEAAGVGPNYDFFKNNRQLILENWPVAKEITGIQVLVLKLSLLWPSGWIDQNKVPVVDAFLNALVITDPDKRRFYQNVATDYNRKLHHRLDGLTIWAPWNIISIDASRYFGGLADGFAWAQVMVLDEARIACGLERYRLAHGAYPATLDALAPVFINSMPHDIFNGEPFRYRLGLDGTFLLYSVGWNERDDGGKYDDWVWPQPRVSP